MGLDQLQGISVPALSRPLAERSLDANADATMCAATRADGITRRSLLKRSLLGAAGLALCDLTPLRAWAQSARTRPARAKSVIQIWLWGGAAQLDTFDPKPDAGDDYCGPFKNPIVTNVDGVRICEMLPLLAQQADKYALIRSMTHGINGHETAAYVVQTGHSPGDRLVYPCVGAVVSLTRGYDHGYAGIVPPYIVLTTPLGRFSEAGFMGTRYKPFATGGDPNQKRFAVEGIVAEGVTDERQRARRELLHRLDTLGAAMPGEPEFAKLDACEDRAYDMILGDAAKVFDLSTEPDAVREQYGRNTFGQSCLAARRLVEQGVPFVAINYKGWDTHKQHFETMRRKLPEFDRGLATLLTDLSSRGLLDSTIVWCSGEFGRTPKIQWEPPWNGGRSHYGACFSALLAGGGFKGGSVVGASDTRGEHVAERPVHPQDVVASLYERLGIDADTPLPNPYGLNIPLMPPAAEPTKSGGLLREIM